MNNKSNDILCSDWNGFYNGFCIEYNQNFTRDDLFTLTETPYFTEAHKKLVEKAEKDSGLAISTIIAYKEEFNE